MPFSLLRLDQTEITAYWPSLLPLITAALPPGDDPGRDERLFTAAVSGGLQVFAALEWEPDGEIAVKRTRLAALVTTQIAEDHIYNIKSLHVFSLYGVVSLKPDQLRSGLRQLAAYARAYGCSRISAVTAKSGVVSLLQRLAGAEALSWVAVSANTVLGSASGEEGAG